MSIKISKMRLNPLSWQFTSRLIHHFHLPLMTKETKNTTKQQKRKTLLTIIVCLFFCVFYASWSLSCVFTSPNTHTMHMIWFDLILSLLLSNWIHPYRFPPFVTLFPHFSCETFFWGASFCLFFFLSYNLIHLSFHVSHIHIATMFFLRKTIKIRLML